MEIILFTMMGVVLYVTSDWLVVMIEKKIGRKLAYRSMLFFAIILVFSFISFSAIQYYSKLPL